MQRRETEPEKREGESEWSPKVRAIRGMASGMWGVEACV